jgi:hypothetical protein
MNNFCTLFDSFYLTRGLAMYESLMEHSSGFHLYIFAFDELSYKILNDLSLRNVTLIPLSDFETEELLAVKSGRSKAEYCWTCTPSVIYHVISYFNVAECTYLDSDLFFYSDPSVLIAELDCHNKNVLITKHRYSFLPRLYEEKRAGIFCVQFMTFRNEASSLKVLDKWRKQCIEWCFARHEDGKFGDQKYLDEWPELYDNVHILEHQGGGIAPWNLTDYVFKQADKAVTGRKKDSYISFNVVFFHYQYVKFLKDGNFDIGWYIIPSGVKKLFYRKYILKLVMLEDTVAGKYPEYRTGYFDFRTRAGIKDYFKDIMKRQFGYNILKLSY